MNAMTQTRTKTESSARTAEALNLALADATVLWFKLHNDHWYVSGPKFFRLHEKYEELYTRWAGIVDVLAERVLTIGHRPIGTLREALEMSAIKERTADLDAGDRVRSTLDDLAVVHARMGEAIELAGKGGDRGTENVLDGIRDETEKTIWMLRAYLAD